MVARPEVAAAAAVRQPAPRAVAKVAGGTAAERRVEAPAEAAGLEAAASAAAAMAAAVRGMGAAVGCKAAD